ncbi:hypothetical protein [Haloarcula montana]|uniref:hypothetical protein n=1 Tax=Haloarcula montana TaxID=3111776 RepID=UPI002D779244|nr:hypothetical protein [Haloarcula sp. GH36]
MGVGRPRKLQSAEDRRPEDLPENVPEPRCGDIVQLRHLDEPGLFKVRTTSRRRPEDAGDGNYGLDEIGGGRVVNLSGPEYAALFETEKSARWPVLFAKADCMDRRRDPETEGLTYYGEPLDVGKAGAGDREGDGD